MALLHRFGSNIHISCSVYVTIYTQERLEKKRRRLNRQIKLTEHIYGPLHKELTSISMSLDGFQIALGTPLEAITNDFKFGLIKKNLSRRTREFHDRLLPHSYLWVEARRETETQIGRSLSNNQISGDVEFAVLSAIGRTPRFLLIEPIFMDRDPLEFMSEKAIPYVNATIIVIVHNKSEGQFTSEHKIHQISIDILTEVRRNPTVQQYRREREDLLKECTSLLQMMEKEFVL